MFLLQSKIKMEIVNKIHIWSMAVIIMIKTERFFCSDCRSENYKEQVMDELNRLIEENKITRQDILEFRTKEDISSYSSSFEAILSWWCE